MALGLLASANYLLASLPDVAPLESENPVETAMMRERGGERTASWIPLDTVAPILVRAVLVGEDANFYGHEGFDTHEIEEAIKRNWEEGRTVRGASTITQQLAKNLYLSSDRTYWRKLKEAILTYRLEQTLTKDRILEIYLNVIEWGDGIYGAEAAALDLFGRSASGVDAAQAATMAAMIPNPLRLHPCVSPESLRTRRDRILGFLRNAGDLTPSQHDRAVSRRPLVRDCPDG